MSRAELAKKFFTEDGYSCSQAIVKAFSDLTSNGEEIMKIASSFGGGFGRLREVCGAFSGMCIIIGLKCGYEKDDGSNKMEHYALIREMADEFKNVNGSIVCRDLIAGTEKLSSQNPSVRTQEYIKSRPCGEIVFSAAEILEKKLKEKGII